MKFIRMSYIDYQEPPFTEILKNDSDHRHTGCASIGILNCLHLLGLLKDEKRSEVLLGLKSRLDSTTFFNINFSDAPASTKRCHAHNRRSNSHVIGETKG